MNMETELGVYLRARFTLLLLQTAEEERALQLLKSVAATSGRPVLAWDIAEGFQALAAERAPPAARDPITALEHIDKADGNALFVLKDFHECWVNAQIKRKLRSVAQRLTLTRKSIVVTFPGGTLPAELKDAAVLLELPPPSAQELEQVLVRISETPGVEQKLTPLGREKLVQAALGLTAAQAQRVFGKAVITGRGVLDETAIAMVMGEKKDIIRDSEALEFYAVAETPDDVGGLEILKSWLRLRERAFTQQARDYGLPAPRGMALIGIPGTGKSLTAKMIGGLWRLPLLRLDVGALFGSLVGEAEERTRRALRLAETIAPCVLWIDEMEKAFAHGGGDSGTSSRVFGTILTWMQEKTAPCFVVGTANDVASLPPEVLRKGRFDEIFFLDLPTAKEREEIFAVHLKKRKRLARAFDLPRLAREAAGYVGAEIEQAIIDAMYVGFNEDRELTTEDISAALRTQVPLSRAQRERIEALRLWLKEGRAQSASFKESTEAQQQFVPLEMS
jgi:AAA+ superfamily predicted ATPase